MHKQYAQGPWTITNAVLRPSKYHDSEYTYITMQNKDGNIAHTNIEEDFNNNIYWESVLKALDDNYDVVIDNIHYKTKHGKRINDNRTGNPVIDADSKPTIKSLTKNITKQAQQYQRKAFNDAKTQELIELGIKQINGKWDIKEYINKDGVFCESLQITKKDGLADISAKLKFKSLITYADMLNKGVKFND